MRIKKAEHKCDGITGWDDIYVNAADEWVIDSDAGDARIKINYCPFCGVELEKVLKEELRMLLNEVNKAMTAFKDRARELGNEHHVMVDPRYHNLIVTKCNLVIAISNLEKVPQ